MFVSFFNRKDDSEVGVVRLLVPTYLCDPPKYGASLVSGATSANLIQIYHWFTV
jgi:hypothetical protein